MKTAIEWLMEELPKHGSGAVRTFGDLFEQAKEMEKGQIENAFENGMHAVNIHNLEQYYSETFCYEVKHELTKQQEQ
jgi:hypothetical protein